MVVSINTDLQPTQESSLVLTTPSPPTDILADFLRLKISANTKRNYGKAIADFCRRIYNSDVSTSSWLNFSPYNNQKLFIKLYTTDNNSSKLN
jgi:hypothetical protein